MNLKDLRDLWESPKGKYALIRVDESIDDGGLVIYDIAGRSVFLVDDDDLHDQVVRRMREAGVSVMDDLPS
ncbi:hypothetical protein [Streptomyces cinereoruber]|uniref:hypothetical protein n=1 Tax=Streptomyces cinereoruber TaxID=67260 RepID=UPI00345DB00F